MFSYFFVGYCEGLGIDVQPIADRYGIEFKPHPGIHYIGFNALCDFYEELSRVTNDPHFTLNWAAAQPDDFRHAGPVVYLASRVASWRDFTEISLHTLQSFGNGFHFSLTEDPEKNSITLESKVHPLASPCRQLLQFQFSMIAQMAIRAIPDVRFKAVTFQHNGNPDDPIYEKAFRGPIEFNAPTNKLICDTKYLDRKTSKAAPLIRQGLKTYIKFQTRRRPPENQNIKVEVASLLPGLFGVKNTNLDSVAKILNISSKKLQRLLADEHTSFSVILDETRQSIAVRSLTETDMTLREIANLLDYASQETFIQAFRRWFQEAPSEFKSRLKSELN